jgi:mannose-1-phosphate guanylyltransferase
VEQQSTLHGEDSARKNGASHGVEDDVVCGLVLAGGEGKRLQPFIKSLGKGDLPKQYVNFIGTRSMLEHTLERAERVIPSERVLTIITESHLKHPEVREQISSRPKDTVIVQPENKETGPGLLLPLMHLHKRYPSSLVLVLPSDHFIWEEDRLMDHAHLACSAVRRDPSRLILLGVKPDRDEPEYGYLVPSKKSSEPRMSEISWFIEKPEQKVARRLTRAGGLWNTMIMAFKASAMLHWVSRLAPALYGQFQQIYQAIGTPGEADVVRDVYRRLEPINFSKEFLEPMVKSYPSSLVALPVRDLLWSDWGTASRIKEVLKTISELQQPNGYRNGKIENSYQPLANFPLNDFRTQPAMQK